MDFANAVQRRPTKVLPKIFGIVSTCQGLKNNHLTLLEEREEYIIGKSCDQTLLIHNFSSDCFGFEGLARIEFIATDNYILIPLYGMPFLCHFSNFMAF